MTWYAVHVSSRFRRLLPGLLVTGAFTAWFVVGTHWGEVSAALAEVQGGWVALSAVVLFSEFYIRAARWKVLLGPLAPDVRPVRLLVATIIGMGLNVILPFRAGDLARPWLGHRETGVAVLPLVTIAVIERVFDILGLVCVLLLMVVLLPTEAAAQGELVWNLKFYGACFGFIGIAALSTFLWLATREVAARALFMRIASLGPPPLRDRAVELFDGFVVGLESVRDRRALVKAGALSVLHWFNGSLSIFVLFGAFDIDLPFAAACFTTVAIALTVALPQAPGFFGVFHVAIERTLVLWGQDAGPSQAFAIVFWAVSFVPVTLAALVLSGREGVRLADFARGAVVDRQAG